MSLIFYQVLHLAGILCLFAAIGGFLALAENTPQINRMVAILHGIGLVLLLVSGFGMAAKNPAINGYPGWVLFKIVLWLCLGGLLVLAKRRVLPAKAIVLIGLVIGLVAAYLGLTWESGFHF
ncbi:MAG: hypothetical protein KDM91_18385 [Verrucomicrobiae bacterium]|nr:hypothetical protein [Verrucomicrobiae bacterium]MCP5550974.1 hypothetical protein [Akkermansiaceae bacterium]